MPIQKSIVQNCRKQFSSSWIRRFSSEIELRKIDKNIRIYSVSSSTVRPLVLMFSWLLAKGKHLQKYREMYMREGFDVKTIQVHTDQLLWPKRVHSMTEKLLDMLAADQTQRPLMVHGFSVGGYVFGEVLLKLLQSSEKYSTIPPRFQGMVFDSPVDMNHIPIGVSRAVTQNEAYQKLIHSLLELYLRLPTAKHYIRSSTTFKENVFDIPALLMYSKSDPVVEPDKIESIASSWREKGVISHTKFWNEAPHVSLFIKNPEEYTKAVVTFIRQCGFTQTTEDIQNKKNPIKKTRISEEINFQKIKSRAG